MEFALTVERLQKRFGRTKALKAIDLSVPRGVVFGFLGLNGAGKTTTLECALGLQHSNRGKIRILGSPPAEIARTAGRVGAVFDSARFPSNLTVRQALCHGRIASGRGGRSPEEVETLLGIRSLKARKTRHLSHGNRHRLSIAMALLGNPELLILDEPFTGLDAAGIEDALTLLTRLNREEGLTVILSSHQLHHIETISTHACIIHEGATVAQGSLDNLLKKEQVRLHLRVDDPAKALEVLSTIQGIQPVQSPTGSQIEAVLTGAQPAAINALLVNAGIAVSELVTRRPSLLTFFQRCIGGEK